MRTFRDLITAWESERHKLNPLTPSTQRRTQVLVREIGKFPLDAQLDRYNDWLAMHRRKKTAPATVTNRIVTILTIARQARVILRHKIPPECVPFSTLEQVRDTARMMNISGPSTPRHASIKPNELLSLIAAARKRTGEIRMETIIPFAVATALRRSELCRITWADVNFNAATLLVRARKNPRKPVDQHIPLSPTALSILRQIGPGHPKTRIFPYHPTALSNAFDAVRIIAGCRHVMFKDLRSTAAQQLFNRGWSADQVAGVTGHQNLRVLLKHYASPDPELLAQRLATEERTLH